MFAWRRKLLAFEMCKSLLVLLCGKLGPSTSFSLLVQGAICRFKIYSVQHWEKEPNGIEEGGNLELRLLASVTVTHHDSAVVVVAHIQIRQDVIAE